MASEADPEQRVLQGETWEAFCEHLKHAGNQVLRDETPATPMDRAEGFRYLTRLLRIGLEMHLEFADPDFPGFFSPSHETAKIGADNPDNLYLMARINPAHDYVIEGERGSVAYLSIGSQRGGYESDGKMEQTGFIDNADLELAADGSFSLVVSRDPQAGNHLPLAEDSNAVLVRQTFLDRRAETPARLSIRRRDAGTRPAPLTAAGLDRSLAAVGQFVAGTAGLFTDWAAGFQAHANALPPADQALCQSVGGDPNIYYYHSYWALAPDEALVIHVPRIPDCRFWNIQINNYWMESLDYRYFRISLNSHSAELDRDGGLTVVLAHTDPGHPNRLETAGHERGTLCLRWVGTDNPVHPSTEVRRIEELTA